MHRYLFRNPPVMGFVGVCVLVVCQVFAVHKYRADQVNGAHPSGPPVDLVHRTVEKVGVGSKGFTEIEKEKYKEAGSLQSAVVSGEEEQHAESVSVKMFTEKTQAFGEEDAPKAINQSVVPSSENEDGTIKNKAVQVKDGEGGLAKTLGVGETSGPNSMDILNSMSQASFAFYDDLPVNRTCNGDELVEKAQGCQPCKVIDSLVEHFKARESNSSHPDLILIPMDLLAVLSEATPNFSEIVLRVADHVVKREKYIRFGGSDHIFICLLPGCHRVMKTILDKHELGKSTRAIWMGTEAYLEDIRALWPCPNRVLLAPPAIEQLIADPSKGPLCENPIGVSMSLVLASVLDRGAGMINHMSRWMCSRQRWKVNVDHLKNSKLKGCILIERHNMCVAIVPKCGSSAMIHVLRRMEGIQEWNNTHHQTHKRTNGMKWIDPSVFEKYKEILLDTNILKVALVREPAKRLLSAYMDKIYTLRQFDRLGYTGKSVPSFEWVINKLWVAQNESRLHAVDEHFRPMINFGSMRYMRYDFVARLDSFSEDLETILSTLGLWERYGTSGWGINGDLSFKTFTKFNNSGYNIGKPIPPNVKYTPALLEKVYKIYEEDYKRFDFRMDLS